MTGLAFVPLAVSAGAGAHTASHVIARHGVRTPLAGAFAVAAVGMALLSQVSTNGGYVRDVLPGMLVVGLGVAVVSVSVAILTGARENENGMLSGLNSTGHEIGGTIGIAVFATIAAGATSGIAGPSAVAGIGHAFVAGGIVTGPASITPLVVLPHARQFLPKLRLNPAAMPGH